MKIHITHTQAKKYNYFDIHNCPLIQAILAAGITPRYVSGCFVATDNDNYWFKAEDDENGRGWNLKTIKWMISRRRGFDLEIPWLETELEHN